LVPAASGTAFLGQQPVRSLPRREVARQLGVLLQEEDNGYVGSVRNYVSLGRFPHAPSMGGLAPRDAEATAAALEQLQLEALASRPLHSLSGGERQRARIAMLLAQDPDVYCLDEPLLHLDINHQLEVMELFRNLAATHGKTVVMVLHDPWWARRFCDHALLMYDSGESVGGTGPDLLTAENLARLYQCGTADLFAARGMDGSLVGEGSPDMSSRQGV
jgi:iron complex transport system ATP-binding protein